MRRKDLISLGYMPLVASSLLLGIVGCTGDTEEASPSDAPVVETSEALSLGAAATLPVGGGRLGGVPLPGGGFHGGGQEHGGWPSNPGGGPGDHGGGDHGGGHWGHDPGDHGGGDHGGGHWGHDPGDHGGGDHGGGHWGHDPGDHGGHWGHHPYPIHGGYPSDPGWTDCVYDDRTGTYWYQDEYGTWVQDTTGYCVAYE